MLNLLFFVFLCFTWLALGFLSLFSWCSFYFKNEFMFLFFFNSLLFVIICFCVWGFCCCIFCRIIWLDVYALQLFGYSLWSSFSSFVCWRIYERDVVFKNSFQFFWGNFRLLTFLFWLRLCRNCGLVNRTIIIIIISRIIWTGLVFTILIDFLLRDSRSCRHCWRHLLQLTH